MARGERRRGRPLALDDLRRIPEVVSLALSLDGARLALVIETPDEVANRLRRRLVVIDLAGDGRRVGPTVTVARGGHRLGQPRWSPDGARLAHVDAHEDVAQAWTWEVASGARRRLTGHPAHVRSPAWAPDGRTLVVVADGAQRRDDPVPVEEPDPRRRVVRVSGHRHKLEGRGWVPVGGARGHLWSVDAQTGAMRQLTDGDADADAPAFSPDGRAVAFMSDRSADRDRHFGGEQIHVVDVATREVRRLTEEGVTCANPAWSPDGGRIAYLRVESPLQLDGHAERLWVVDVTTGEETCWTRQHDRPVGFRPGGYRTPSAPAWLPDGAAVLQIVADGGTSHLARVSPGRVEALTTGPEVVAAFSASDDRARVALLRSDAVHPPEPWLWLPGRTPERAWRAWPRALSGVRRVAPVRLAVDRPEGLRIEGWLLLPATAGPRDRAPLVLLVHGGPHNAFGERFLAEAQLLAGAGMAVLLANPRGSGGHGEAFGRAVVGDWGGADLDDLLAVLDAALAAHAERLDAGRTAIMGGSFGGFMATWAITRTDRFACAVAGAPVTWPVAMELTADIGPTWSRSERAVLDPDARSPLAHAERIRTPLLLYHGEADLRVPIGQSEALLTAITAAGGQVELLRVPGEGHVLPGDASPVHARQVREAVLEFLGRHLGVGA